MRAYYRTWYRDLVTALPEVKDGFISVRPAAGPGLELAPGPGQEIYGDATCLDALTSRRARRAKMRRRT